ncbi:MAG TPA: CRISPR-associated helicase Cas3' [Balneolales bacterium]|nr:CRISPR-associated helicase Cas3' [Balneolales bacterium]
MRLFSSSDSIIKDSEFLFNNLNKDYWAHIEGKEPTESLLEHSLLVANYFEKIITDHGIEVIIDQIIQKLITQLNFDDNEKAGNYIKEIFTNSIFLHDLGKVNSNFQVIKMNNPAFKKVDLKIKHYHSFPGAYIFAVYHLNKIFNDKSLSKYEKNFLAFIVFCFTNPIIKHHSSYIDFYQNFNDQNIIQECSNFLELYNIQANKSIKFSIFSFVEEIRNRFDDHSSDDTFLSLFVLIKLSYSLLTASDFYATNEFMANLKVNEFGLLGNDLKNKVKQDFWSLKDYNADLSQNFNYYCEKSFSDLQIRGNENLNILRQKLTAEVISTLRKNPKNYWYYIEAPTGAGKTNLSLGCIAELLETDLSLNKIFYVFPFTTLITQTFEGIKETIGLTNNELMQLHSKTGLHNKNENDISYGKDKMLYLDHLFVNYPFVVTSHVKFFEIIKGNDKENNYLFHRLCNSIVVIDELQSYNPKHWDKIVYFIEHYAQLFNIRFIIMSATLPKIDELRKSINGKFISLTPNKNDYFKNPNFVKRVDFDFSLLDELKPYKKDKDSYFDHLAKFIKSKAEEYALNNKNKVRVLVEFITKNSASSFFNLIEKGDLFENYNIYIISGDILEPRRKQVIYNIKKNLDEKVILISTQVVEAGVDIDMDIGFKNKALLDSDEQLAGRINRNASKKDCKVFLFDLDSAKTIYGKDERYKQQQKDEYLEKNWKSILINKTFHELYHKVFIEKLKSDWTNANKFPAYKENFKRLDFKSINKEFQLIEDNQSESVFIPIEIPFVDYNDKKILKVLGVFSDDKKGISGEKVYYNYIAIIKNEKLDFFEKRIELKKIAGLMSMFIINVYPKVINQLIGNFDIEKEKYGFKYLSNINVYSYEHGFDMSKVKESIFL